ncbi:hypothetical protein LXL04_039022 [Taraxacum kok-saghyz]
MPKYIRNEKMLSSSQPIRENGGVTFQCPMLTPTNYTIWAILMEAIMDAQGTWEVIASPGEVVAEGLAAARVAVDEKNNKSARSFIFQAILEDILLQATKKNTAKKLWDSLKTRYLGVDRVQEARLHTLKSDFQALRMKDGESINEFAGKLSAMISKYNSFGATLEDNVLYSDIDTMSFEEAIRIKAYEDRIRLRSGNASTKRNIVLSRTDGQTSQKTSGGSLSNGRGRGSAYEDRGGRNGGRGRGSTMGRGGQGASGWRKSTWNNYRRGRDKKHIKCFNYEDYGHYTSEYVAPKKNGDEANLAHT